MFSRHVMWIILFLGFSWGVYADPSSEHSARDESLLMARLYRYAVLDGIDSREPSDVNACLGFVLDDGIAATSAHCLVSARQVSGHIGTSGILVKSSIFAEPIPFKDESFFGIRHSVRGDFGFIQLKKDALGEKREESIEVRLGDVSQIQAGDDLFLILLSSPNGERNAKDWLTASPRILRTKIKDIHGRERISLNTSKSNRPFDGDSGAPAFILDKGVYYLMGVLSSSSSSSATLQSWKVLDLTQLEWHDHMQDVVDPQSRSR